MAFALIFSFVPVLHAQAADDSASASGTTYASEDDNETSKEVALKAGETAVFTDTTGNYVSADTSDLDTSVATVALTGAPSYAKSLCSKVTALESGKLYGLVNTQANKPVTSEPVSASATGLPILLVFNEKGILYGEQPEYLAGLENCTFTVIGGESAVSEDLAAAIGEYGDVERLAGGNRFETSVLVAEKYFEAPEMAVLAYAWNYPDGLCGGALAYSMGAPLILTMTKYESEAVEYAESVGLTTGIVLGGDSLISDAAVRAIFAMDAEAEIVVK